jgi:hypothetical protein
LAEKQRHADESQEQAPWKSGYQLRDSHTAEKHANDERKAD